MSEMNRVGTFKLRGVDIYSSLDAALAAGYRLIDTASVYRNEKDICIALEKLLPKYNCSRSDIFITSKLGPKEHGAEGAQEAVRQALGRLQMDYLDLYLIHWPGVQGMKPEDPRQADLRRQTWQTMEDLHREGKLKAIGVSNYTIDHMTELFSYCTVPPAVLQTEFHPHLQRPDLVEYCRNKGVHFQAYSSLGTSDPQHRVQLLENEVVQKIAKECGRSSALVLLRWAIQQNISVLPKSTNPDHIRENMCVFDFELSQEQMKLLSEQEQATHYCWNSDKIS